MALSKQKLCGSLRGLLLVHVHFIRLVHWLIRCIRVPSVNQELLEGARLLGSWRGAAGENPLARGLVQEPLGSGFAGCKNSGQHICEPWFVGEMVEEGLVRG